MLGTYFFFAQHGIVVLNEWTVYALIISIVCHDSFYVSMCKYINKYIRKNIILNLLYLGLYLSAVLLVMEKTEYYCHAAFF